jgi:magnesium-protoporphyrin IX monomethyl ester (oxidative) cyclase
MANAMLGKTAFAPLLAAKRVGGARRVARFAPVRATQSGSLNENLGFKTMREGIKEAANETILTPRFYTTDFDELEELFNLEKNPGMPAEALEAMLTEFRQDYNQKHFVRNETFKQAADKIEVQF